MSTSAHNQGVLRDRNTIVERWIIPALAFGAAIYHLGANYYGLLQPLWHTAMHLAWMLPLALLITRRDAFPGMRGPVVNLMLAAAVAAAFLYVVIDYDAKLHREVFPNVWDQLGCIVAVVIILETTRRYYGWPLPTIAAIAIAYAFLGDSLPPSWRHAGWDIEFMTFNLFMQSQGIFGVAPKISATLIFTFVMLGAFLGRVGTTDRIIELAKAFTQGSYGGPAKVAVFSSALMGSVSGSSIANVVATGRFTIPMMIKSGFHRRFAAAVEAVSSTGGLLMPPIMGAGAFVMAELLQISYWEVVVAAIIPAVLYFSVVFWSVHFESHKQEIVAPREGTSRWLTFRRCAPYLLPVVILIGLIAFDTTPMRAALYTIAITVAGAWLLGARFGLIDIYETLIEGTRQAVGIACACACAGLIIGAMDGTGLAIKFSQLIIGFAGTFEFFALLLGMVVVVILGMGLPATAAYILGAAVVAPALIQIGFPPIAVHMFVFYYSNLSHITPPVDLATYAAAGIAEANPLDASIRAIMLGAIAFVLPFLFIYNPILLLQDVEALALSKVLVTAVIGTIVLAGGMIGWFRGRLSLLGRILLIAGGFLLVHVDLRFTLAGVAVIGGFFIADRFLKVRILRDERV